MRSEKEINISEVVLIPGGHSLQEEDEDPEENSCISRGTIRICDLSEDMRGLIDTNKSHFDMLTHALLS